MVDLAARLRDGDHRAVEARAAGARRRRVVRFDACQRTPCLSSPKLVRAADLLLQLQDAVDQRFGGRRAARHVDVDRHDAIAAAHHGVGIVVVAAAVGAAAHRDHPLRVGHLVVDLAQRRRHLVDQRAGHDHHVGLARRRAEHHAVAVEVQARGAGVHHLDRAAGQAEGHRPHRAGARPVQQRVEAGGDEALLDQRVVAFRTQDVVEPPFRQRVVHQAPRRSAITPIRALPSSTRRRSRARAAEEHAHLDQAERRRARGTPPPTETTKAISRSKTMNRIAIR